MRIVASLNWLEQCNHPRALPDVLISVFAASLMSNQQDVSRLYGQGGVQDSPVGQRESCFYYKGGGENR